jgi:hypothetical protein
MIECFNFSSVITDGMQINALEKINFLFSSDNWCKDVPPFQTYSHLQEFKEFDIFVKTFEISCQNYILKYQKNINLNSFFVKMWCYHDSSNSIKKNAKEFGYKDYGQLWHNHSKNGSTLSGVYFLQNPTNEPTLFKDFKLLKANPFTWHIFKSDTYHSPPQTTSDKGRYTLAADFYCN